MRLVDANENMFKVINIKDLHNFRRNYRTGENAVFPIISSCTVCGIRLWAAHVDWGARPELDLIWGLNLLQRCTGISTSCQRNLQWHNIKGILLLLFVHSGAVMSSLHSCLTAGMFRGRFPKYQASLCAMWMFCSCIDGFISDKPVLLLKPVIMHSQVTLYEQSSISGDGSYPGLDNWAKIINHFFHWSMSSNKNHMLFTPLNLTCKNLPLSFSKLQNYSIGAITAKELAVNLTIKKSHECKNFYLFFFYFIGFQAYLH